MKYEFILDECTEVDMNKSHMEIITSVGSRNHTGK